MSYRNSLLVALCLLSSCFLRAQDIPFGIGFVDAEQTAAQTLRLIDKAPTENGVFLVFIDLENDDASVVRYFDGLQVRDLYSSDNLIRLDGVTEQGVFLNEFSNGSAYLFISNDGTVTELGSGPLRAEHTVFYQDELILFRRNGIVKYDADGEETILDPGYLGFEDVTSFQDPFAVDGFLYYPVGDSYTVRAISGGPSVTTFRGAETVLVTEDYAYGVAENKLLALNLNTLETEDLYAATELGKVSGLAPTASGIVFFNRTEDPRERTLYTSDGTPEGTVSLGVQSNQPSLSNQSPRQSLIDRPRAGQDFAGALAFVALVDGGQSYQPYVTDGTPEGTYPIAETTPATNPNNYRAVSTNHLSDGTFTVEFLVNEAGVLNYSVYGLDADLPGDAGFVVAKIELADEFHSVLKVGDRLIVSDGFESRTQYSVGQTAGDVLELDLPPYSTAIHQAGENLIYFTNRRFPDEGLDLYLSKGLTDTVVPITVVREKNFNEAIVDPISFGDKNFVYTFDALLGETIYEIRPDLTIALVADFSDRSLGDPVIRMVAASDHLMVTKGNFRRSDFSLWITDGSNDNSREIMGLQAGGTIKYYGRIGDDIFINGITEYNLTTGKTTPLPAFRGRRGAQYHSPTVFKGSLYVMETLEIEPSNQHQLRVLRYTPGQSEIDTVYFHDDQFGPTNDGLDAMQTDGENLYFTNMLRSDQMDIYLYDGIADSPTLSDAVNQSDNARFPTFRRVGDLLYLHYDAGFNPSAFRQIKNGTLSVGRAETNRPERLVAYAGSTIFSTDFREVWSWREGAGQNLLEGLPVSYMSGTLALSEDLGAYFVALTSENEFELWASDGTPAGTRKVMDLPITGDSFSDLELRIVGNLAVVADLAFDDQVIFAINLNDIEIIDLEVEAGEFVASGELIVQVGNRIYFPAVAPGYGEEPHFVEIAGGNFITGRVFRDTDASGTLDNAETGFERVTVRNGSGLRSFTNEAGIYAIPAVPDQDYVISVDEPICYELTTPGNYDVTYREGLMDEFDFGLSLQTGSPAIRALLADSPTRCNTATPFWLNVFNEGCEPYAGTMDLLLGEQISFNSGDDEPEVINDTLLRFTFDTIQPGEKAQLQVILNMPDEFFTGRPVDLTLAAMPDGEVAGSSPADTFFFSQILRCAYDPNDKQVSPSRAEPSGSNYTQFDEKLRYTVRFQNTGNDTAVNVRIEDQLSLDLDWETFTPLASSHTYTASITKAGRITFRFDNIQLPDSTTNLVMSQGYVTFELETKAGLSDFSTVRNTAGIYFDFNQPVITNTVTSTLVEFLDEDQDGFNFYEDCNDQDAAVSPAAEEIAGNKVDENCDGSLEPVSVTVFLEGDLSVYPNPTSGLATVAFSESKPLLLTVFSATGKVLQRVKFSGTHTIDLGNVARGNYLIRLVDPASGASSTRWIQRQ